VFIQKCFQIISPMAEMKHAIVNHRLVLPLGVFVWSWSNSPGVSTVHKIKLAHRLSLLFFLLFSHYSKKQKNNSQWSATFCSTTYLL